MKILILCRQSSAVGYYRSTIPARILRKLGHEVTYVEGETYRTWMKPNAEDWFRGNLGKFDLVIADRPWGEDELKTFRGFVHASPDARLVIDFDDNYRNIPWWNQMRSKYQPGQPFRVAGDLSLKLAELTTVSTPALAEAFVKATHDVMAVENAIDPKDWEGLAVAPERKGDDKFRILYGGAAGHYGDLDEVRPGLEAFLRNPPVPVRLVCIGTVPAWVHDLGREFPGRVVTLPWVRFADYPQTIAWGGFDLAIAPLANEPFNLCKSAIKVYEAAMQGIPMVCSKVGPYAGVPDGCAIRLDNRPDDWQEALRTMATDKGFGKSVAERCREWVLEEHTPAARMDRWAEVVERAMSRPKIVELADTVVQEDRERALAAV